jgi:hypothetical protein
MDETSMRLPIRLLPRRGGQIFRIFFFMFFFCFSIFWIVMAASGTMHIEDGKEPIAGFRYLFPAFGIPFVLVGVFGLASSLVKLLPGSPYYYVEIAPGGIIVRKAWKTRRFAWSELSPFGVSVKVNHGKNGTTTTYWVVALRAADADRLAYETERYNRSVLQINAGEYGVGDADMAASVLSDWLSQIRVEAVDHPGRLPDIVAVPPNFRGRVIEVGLAMMSARATSAAAPRSSSVIER